MNAAEIIHQSLEQVVAKVGDPTAKVFALMYQRFPELLSYKEENSDWENYMFEEIITNFMQFGDDPDMALLTIKDMAVHHELIGVPKTVFNGLYQALFEVASEAFEGPYKPDMVAVWQENIALINECIEAAAA